MHILPKEFIGLPEYFTPIKDQSQHLISYGGYPNTLPMENIRSLHFHSLLEIGICRSGNGLCVFGETAETIAKGDIMIVTSDIPHYSRSLNNEGCLCDFIYFDPDKLLQACHITRSFSPNDFQIPYILRCEESSSDPYNMYGVLAEMIHTVVQQKEHFEERAAALFLLFTLQLSPAKPSAADERKKSRSEKRLSPALNRIIVSYQEKLTLNQLAAECYLSPSYFSRLFLREYGTPPLTYLNRFRTQIGAQMLRHTDMSIAQISMQVGFNSTSDFYRHFTEDYGCSPSAYRTFNFDNSADMRPIPPMHSEY